MNSKTSKHFSKRFWIGLLAGLWLLSALSEQPGEVDPGPSSAAAPQIDVHDHVSTLLSTPVYQR